MIRKWLTNMIDSLSPLAALAVGLTMVMIGGGIVWFGGAVAKSGFDDLKAERRAGGTGAASLKIEKAAYFFVEVDQDVYQLGVVLKIFNADPQVRTINDITLENVHDAWSLVARGSWYIQRIQVVADRAGPLEDSYITAGAPAYFRRLLPFKITMTQNGGDTPIVILRGRWSINMPNGSVQATAPFYSVYPSAIALSDWNGLAKPSAAIDIESLRYSEVPERPVRDAPKALIMLYNRDRSATIDNPYVAQTSSAKSAAGVLLWADIPQGVDIDDQWEVMGSTYAEVWSDPERRALYNSVVSPDADGRPQAFGFFAGRESVMAGPVAHPLSAATTRPADIIELYPSST
jgi:hypothetical protein